jgi:hypothetical protein
MRGASAIQFLSPAALLVVFSVFVPTYAQPQDSTDIYQPPDTVFNEILLSDEGITAIDTAGFEWHYDFDKETFVVGGLPKKERDGVLEQHQKLRTDKIPVEERCTEEKIVKPFERSVWVGYDEYVEDDIIAYGRVTIKGWAKGDVKSIRKRVLVTESGRVDGDIEAPEVIIRPGGVVLGRVTETGAPLELEDITKSFSVDGVIVVLSFTAFFMFCGFLAMTLMPKQMAVFGRCLNRYAVRTYLLGFLFILLMPAILVLVTVTVIGLMLIPFVPLIYVIAMVLGVISFGETLGRQFSLRYLGGEKSGLFQSTVGIILLMSFWMLVAVLLGAGDKVSNGFGIFFLVVSILLTSFPVLGGIGAALLTRFGFREYPGWKDRAEQPGGTEPPAPAPPPIPDDSSYGIPPSQSQPPGAT